MASRGPVSLSSSDESLQAWINQPINSWLFSSAELEHTASRLDKIPLESEVALRSKGASFIVLVGMHLRLPQSTLYVATTLLHRFYMRFSIKQHHQYDIGATCIFLATKIEETARRLKDLVIACCRVAQKNDKLQIDEQSKEYWRWRDIILFNEELLLEAICFDLEIRTPYPSLVYLTRRFVKDERDKAALSKSAWAFINDSVRTTLCLRYSTNVIAAAALYCASTIRHIDIFPDGNGPEWWDDMGVDIADIKDACNAMADLYDSAAAGGKKIGEQAYARMTAAQTVEPLT